MANGILQLFGTFLVIASTVAVTVPLTLWTLDRAGPYERLFGMLDYGRSSECGPGANYPGSIRPGSCVAVEWTIDLHNGYKNCYPVNSLHVSRTIRGADGVTRELPKTERYFGPGKQPLSEKLRRPFILPDFSIPGPAIYHSEACFTCNPLQRVLGWPVCISTPEVYYEVAN